MRWMGVVALATVVGCSGEEPPAPELAPCEGGGEPFLEIGDGGQLGFEGFADGQEVDLVIGGAQMYGFQMDLRTEGLNTGEPMSAVVRVGINEEPSEDAIALLNVLCVEERYGWVSVHAPVDAAYQEAAAAAGLEGAEVHITATLTDDRGVAASGSFDGYVVVP